MYKRIAVLFAAGVLGAPVLSEELRDPTKPPQQRSTQQEAAAVTQYSLESILFSDSRRIAVINGESVATGGTVGGAVVKRIARDRVLLEINGNTRTLVLDSAPAIRR